MEDFCLMTDSSCDLPEDLVREMELSVLPLSVHMGGQTFRNWPDGREISFASFYSRVRAGEMPTSSAVSVGDFEEEMEKNLELGLDILCIAFSSGLSSTYQSAAIAASHLRPRFPERRVEVVDSLCASGGQGLLVWLCDQQRRAGKSFQEILAYAEQTKGHIAHWFTVDDLNHLKRGGRINAAAAFFGTMLAIKPVLHVDDIGKLVNVDKARGRKASLLALVDRMEQSAVNPRDQTVFITHGDCLSDAEFVAEEIRRRFGTSAFHISFVGPVIGTHSGPGTLALFFLARER